MDNYFTAWSKISDKFDIAPAARLYARDSDLVVWDILPPLNGYRGIADYKVNIQKNAYDKFERFRLTSRDDLRVTQSGLIAWTTVTFHAEGKLKNGMPLKLDGRLTDIWERRGRQWLIVHEHSSVPLSQ